MHSNSSSIAAINAALCVLSADSAGWPARTSANDALNLQRPHARDVDYYQSHLDSRPIGDW
jgi:hypothetical protein